MSGDPNLLSGLTGEYRRIAEEVRSVAHEEAKASGLPGLQGGPADAYRHLVGAGELTRRLGVLPAWTILEGNEQRSAIARERRLENGLPVLGSQQEAASAMDRHNNLIGIGHGVRSATFDDVVQHARNAMSRAGNEGSGSGGRPTWQSRDNWDDSDASDRPVNNWPSVDWDRSLPHPSRAAYELQNGTARGQASQVIQTPIGPALVDPDTNSLNFQ